LEEPIDIIGIIGIILPIGIVKKMASCWSISRWRASESADSVSEDAIHEA
jgi:hypothetical protein